MSIRNLNPTQSKKTINFEVDLLSGSNAERGVKVKYENIPPND